ncbi:hypothetical protein RhiJN_06224 [Ceratobasidium sp. AG-Ba]|nr:hypothetical protein RhiJN_06224 [Ceratobasidium sp. AG-Ba]
MCGTTLLLELGSAPQVAQKKQANASQGISACINALRSISTTWPAARPLADDLQRRLQGESIASGFGTLRVDGPTSTVVNDEEQDQEEAQSISNAFNQHMRELGHIQLDTTTEFSSAGFPYTFPITPGTFTRMT